MASSRSSSDARDELRQGLPATGSAPIGGTGDLDRPLGDHVSEHASGRPVRDAPGEGGRAARRRTAASRLLLVGGVLFVIGLVVSLIADGFADGIGVTFLSLSTIPTLGGLGLLLFSGVEKRAGEDRPFA